VPRPGPVAGHPCPVSPSCESGSRGVPPQIVNMCSPPVANATPHFWAAVVGATGLTAASGTTGSAFRGPQDLPVICAVGSQPDMYRCDDTAYGKGAGGELTYSLKLHAKTSTTIWFTVVGSDQGLAAAQAEFSAASADPGPGSFRPNSPRAWRWTARPRCHCQAIRCLPPRSPGASRSWLTPRAALAMTCPIPPLVTL
jgi:hypothetical protein